MTKVYVIVLIALAIVLPTILLLVMRSFSKLAVQLKHAAARAVKEGDVVALRKALSRPAFIRDREGVSASSLLGEAIEQDAAECVQVLLECGARLSRTEIVEYEEIGTPSRPHSAPYRYTALQWAAYHGSSKVVGMLFANHKVDLDVNAPAGRDKRTPLHLASATGCTAVVRLLVEAGADKEGGKGVRNRFFVSLVVPGGEGCFPGRGDAPSGRARTFRRKGTLD